MTSFQDCPFQHSCRKDAKHYVVPVIQNEISASGENGLRLSGYKHTVQRNQITN